MSTKDKTYLSEERALALLVTQGDYTETQARAVLTHSKKRAFAGVTYYPKNYIYKRLRENKNKETK